jgi:3-oxosteroid 1-dehydrogenase
MTAVSVDIQVWVDTTSAYKQNGNLGLSRQAPVYAVKVWPGDLGTKGGMLTDKYAQALKEGSD